MFLGGLLNTGSLTVRLVQCCDNGSQGFSIFGCYCQVYQQTNHFHKTFYIITFETNILSDFFKTKSKKLYT